MANDLVPSVPSVEDFTVIATSPKEMEKAQTSLISWASNRIESLKSEHAEAYEQYKTSVERKWNSSAWKRQMRKVENQMEFYSKVKAALEAGYYIVPPFPIDVFAIRTNRLSPDPMYGRNKNNHDQPPQALPQGEGGYVDPRPIRESFQSTEKNHAGQIVPVTKYFATQFKVPEFPFKLAKAQILAATDDAMKKKIFDTFGVLPRTRSPDPIVCGQILYPNVKLSRYYEHNKAITFFVAWWLDTKTL